MAKQKFTLKQWRRISGLSQTELAEIVDKDVSTIVRWEKDGAPTKIEDIAKLEKALNINWQTDICMP